jgi:hypothetical protein
MPPYEALPPITTGVVLGLWISSEAEGLQAVRMPFRVLDGVVNCAGARHRNVLPSPQRTAALVNVDLPTSMSALCRQLNLDVLGRDVDVKVDA